jgi:predicted ester cyclase
MAPASHESQVDANRATVKEMLAQLNAGNIDGFVEHLADNYVRHCQAMPPDLQEIRGPEGMRAWLLANQEGFPDYREDLELLVGEGDFVAWRSVGQGTHMASFGPFPPTGRRMTIVIIGMHRFENGRVAETWTAWDNVAALSQLGLFPPKVSA